MARRIRKASPAGCGQAAGRGLSRLAAQDKAKWEERQRLAKLEAAKERIGWLDFNRQRMAVVKIDDSAHLTALLTVCNLPENKWLLEYNSQSSVAYVAKQRRAA